MLLFYTFLMFLILFLASIMLGLFAFSERRKCYGKLKYLLMPIVILAWAMWILFLVLSLVEAAKWIKVVFM